MKLSRKLHQLEEQAEEALHIQSRSHVLRNIGLATAGVTVVALGVAVGRELRSRYKFARRTPYDLFSNAGDNSHDVESGVGI